MRVGQTTNIQGDMAMNRSARQRPLVTATLIAVSCAALVGWGSGRDDDHDKGHGKPPLTVPKPSRCGPHDNPESGLQGQVPAALRAAGFKGFNCNLELLGQARGDGANWQTTEFKDRSDQHGWGYGRHHSRDREHVCAYHGTASPTRSLPGRTQLGSRVIDVTNMRNPTQTATLTTTSMLDPWESLKVNERRQLLAADNGANGAGGPEVDIYDVSDDCRFPQLLASLPVGTGTDGGGVVTPIIGHEGSFAPDGLTYYGGGRVVPNNYYAVDVSDPTQPKLMAAWNVPQVASGARTHGLSVSDDGMRGYFVSIGSVTPAGLTDPTVAANNGLVIYDLSD